MAHRLPQASAELDDICWLDIAEGDGEIESARLRTVELGDVYGNMVAMNKGLQSGERVITTGVNLIRDGDQVRVIP